MHVDGESDGRVVPAKGTNNGGQPPAERLEGRRPTKESIGQPTPSRTQCRTSESSGLLGVRQVAQKEKRTRFTALLHHITVARLQESFYALKREAAPGVDGVTWREYETDLGTHVVDLHRRVHAGTYRAQPSKRAYIPKADGRQRPLGIAALEDKIVQHAVGVVLSAIYEQDFLGFSYGFRPQRSHHHALDALWVGLMRKKVNWVLDADIRTFLDAASYCPPRVAVTYNRLGCVSITLIRKPLRRPHRTWSAWSSQRLTRCNTVWRETPSRRVASSIGR